MIKKKKLFNMKSIPLNLKNLFKRLGIKKSDFKNEHLALNIFKFFMKFFDELQNNKKSKIHNLEKIGNKKLSIISENTEELLNSLQKLSEKEITNLNKKSIPIPPAMPNLKVPIPKINQPIKDMSNNTENLQEKVS